MDIALTNGGYTRIDDADFPLIGHLSWLRDFKGYARANAGFMDGKYRYFWAHRLIIGDQPPLMVDHVNRDRLDNRRNNLRHVTYAENARNRGMSRANSSGYRGVCLHTGVVAGRRRFISAHA